MADFIFFRRMLTPILIQILFWVAVLAAICQGIYFIVTGQGVLQGLYFIIAGPIFARLVAEFVILFFRMNETLTDISHEIVGNGPGRAKITVKTQNTGSM